MHLVLPFEVRPVYELEEGLMDEGRGVERVVPMLASKPGLRKAVQFIVNQWK
ncbi:MAG: hypothetical protein RhofKO_10460 [Rhodothermales bacterium]